jgi:hypothetical protein
VRTLRAGTVRPSLDALLAMGGSAALLVLGFVTTGGFDGSVSISAANTWTEIAVALRPGG